MRNIDLSLAMRELARAQRNWEFADLLREGLRADGVIVRDTAAGQEAILLAYGITVEQWEQREAADHRANAAFDAWLFTMRSKMNLPGITR
jgi:hypothetical protein